MDQQAENEAEKSDDEEQKSNDEELRKRPWLGERGKTQRRPKRKTHYQFQLLPFNYHHFQNLEQNLKKQAVQHTFLQKKTQEHVLWEPGTLLCTKGPTKFNLTGC